MSATFDFDVLGLGAVAVDDFVYVDAYPPPDVKLSVLGRGRQLGGLTATALVAAARLGARAGYAGVLGDDELSRAAASGLAQEQIDLSHLVIQPDARPIYSTIIVSPQRGTRNIFFDCHGVVGAHPLLPEPAVIRRSRVLLVDSFGLEGMARAARIAHDAGIPIVADLEEAGSPLFDELLSLVDHLILSSGFAQALTQTPDPASAAAQLWSSARKVVIVTAGADGMWYLADGNTHDVHYQPAFQVQVVDSTGCGDVFHGAYAAGLARGLGLADRIRVASAAAALKATKPGGQAGIPDWPHVEQFLQQQSKDGVSHAWDPSRQS
ncbi:MAG TPA: PfkB family carbohydrate kinase [Herpetosiphonaceae bacterium]|nr:PfkB family carbohydrate kinase [Herpetosiphonaceae bacterium]